LNTFQIIKEKQKKKGGSLSPFCLRYTREIDCRSGAPHPLAAPSNLPRRIGLSKLCHSYVSGRWSGSNLEPFDYKVNTDWAI